MTEENLVKLSVNSERFWAEDLGEGRYKVRNITVLNQFSLNDIIDAEGNILERFGRNGVIQYVVPEGKEVRDVYKTIYEYFQNRGILIEGLYAGTVGATIPNSMSDEEALVIVSKCPVECILLIQEV